jgi:hypothetical protein
VEVFVPDRYEATEWYEGALGMKVYSKDGARAVRPDLPPDGRLRVAGARAATPNLVTEVGGGPSSTNSSTVSGGQTFSASRQPCFAGFMSRLATHLLKS